MMFISKNYLQFTFLRFKSYGDVDTNKCNHYSELVSYKTNRFPEVIIIHIDCETKCFLINQCPRKVPNVSCA